MRTFAHTILIACCLLTVQSRICPADENRSLKPVGQVKVEKNKKNLGVVVYRPDLSVAQNNQRLEEYRAQTSSFSVAVPRRLLTVMSPEQQGLVNRSVKLDIQGQSYFGRISAVMLDGSQNATLFAQIDNLQDKLGSEQLVEETGVLSIGE